MISTHYTLEIYDSSQTSFSKYERYQTAHTVTLHPMWMDLYYHGTMGAHLRTRAFRTVERPPEVMQDINLVCWRALDSLIEHDPITEPAVELFERLFTQTEKTLLISRFKDTLSAEMTGRLKKIGLYKESMGELSLHLLQRNLKLNDERARMSFVFDKTIFPDGPFTVTTRVWVAAELLPIAEKIARAISRIDSKKVAYIAVAEHSSKDAPSLQLSQTFSNASEYLKNCDHEDLSLDISLDLLLRVIAASYHRYYWK